MEQLADISGLFLFAQEGGGDEGGSFLVFEVGLVATLQAFIFSILTSIYIGGAVAETH